MNNQSSSVRLSNLMLTDFYLLQNNKIIETFLPFSIHTDDIKVASYPIWDIVDDEEISNYFKKCSENVSGEIMKRLPNEYGGFIVSMLLSDKSGLDEDTRTSLYRCGTGHIMAVSGLHLVILMSLLSVFLSFFGLSGKIRFLISEFFIIVFFIIISPDTKDVKEYNTIFYYTIYFGKKQLLLIRQQVM